VINKTNHIPVLLNEAVDFLVRVPSGTYVDGTLGGGGHSYEILKRQDEKGRLLGIDWDDFAISKARKRLRPFENRFVIKKGNFADIKKILAAERISSVDGMLLDLGVSSFQIDTPERGFSYLNSGPLDMRMSDLIEKPALKIINQLSEKELTAIFKDYGEERRSYAIAKTIVKFRQDQEIETTEQLSEIIKSVIPFRYRIKTLARIFQAVRIATNFELDNLKKFLNQSLGLLKKNGRLVIISFHSLEDRVVKEFFVNQANPCVCPPDLPYCACGKKPTVKILTRKPVKPSNREIEENPRCKSSKLRAAEKL